MAPATTVEEYLETLTGDRRAAVEILRRTIREAAPEAIETIAYSMPAFRSHGGQFLVSYPYIDEDGVERQAHETCTYLVKRLT